MGTENVRMQVVEAVAIDRGVRGASVEVRSFEHIDGAPNGERRWGDVFPSRAGIFGDLDIAVVAANPNQAFTDGRRRDGQNGSGRLLGIFRVDGSAGEVGTDDLTTGASVGGLHEELRAEVQEAEIMRGEDHGNRTIEMIFLP